MNLGISENFGVIDFEHLTFPTTMRVDWIRVYQRSDSINIGCDPKDFPTQAYINESVIFHFSIQLPCHTFTPQVHRSIHEPKLDHMGGRF